MEERELGPRDRVFKRCGVYARVWPLKHSFKGSSYRENINLGSGDGDEVAEINPKDIKKTAPIWLKDKEGRLHKRKKVKSEAFMPSQICSGVAREIENEGLIFSSLSTCLEI